ncbi:MAG: SDR family NAD(P)-dependent oxidoreductase [Pseudomonadales bacterium]|jgi:short-subunit dehydrogenase|tara:strand:- start:4322 stop:5083 length:762 start_codon:yes stop_codon:yes gene_type:complete
MSRGVALVTGASSGIGDALARVFAEKGFDLVISARREDRLTALADELSVDVMTVACDLSTPEGIEKLIAATAETKIDVLVNNAGIAYSGDFSGQRIDDIQNMTNLNIIAPTALCHHFIGRMIKQGAGRILNVASVASFQPVPSMSAYAATKAYVLSLTESLSEECRGSGVYITALCPGLTKTDMVEDVQGSNVPEFLMSDPHDVAREGYDALMSGEVIRIPGVTNQAAIAWAKHQPRWLVRGLGGLLAKISPK